MNKTGSLDEIVSTLQELKQMYQINLELMEQLVVTYAYITDNDIPVPNEPKFTSLLNKARALLREICSNQKSQNFFIGNEFSHGKKKPFGDGDFTEPGYSLV